MKLDDALQELRTRPSMSLRAWATLNDININTAPKLAAKGEVEGIFRIGSQYRVPSLPWRRRLGLTEGEAA